MTPAPGRSVKDTFFNGEVRRPTLATVIPGASQRPRIGVGELVGGVGISEDRHEGLRTAECFQVRGYICWTLSAPFASKRATPQIGE